MQNFLKVRAKNLVKITRIGKVMGRKRPPTVRELSSKFRHKNTVFEARCLNYTNNYSHNNKHERH